MVNHLRDLLRESVVDAPRGDIDVASVLTAGRRRVRSRRTALLVGTAALVALVVGGGAALLGLGLGSDFDAANRSGQRQMEPVGPVLSLADARRAREGTDYRVLAKHTNEDLDRAQGQYFAGVTDDDQVLFLDGPRALPQSTGIALMDPRTGEKKWLPGAPRRVEWPVELSAERLVFIRTLDDDVDPLQADVFDRVARTWSTIEWRALPIQGRIPVLGQVSSGPDDRFYVGLFRPGDNGRSDLWSVSMSDPADVRNEHLVVGAFNVTGDLLTWTDGGDGNEAPTGHVHVRNLASGQEASFDPRPGDRCSQQSLGRTKRYIVLGLNCGTLDLQDDNWFQVFTADGDPVVTVRDDGIDEATVSDSAVTLHASAAGELSGNYVYVFSSGRLLRVSDAVSRFGLGGWPSGDFLLWDTPVSDGHGATQWLGELP
jgi:hypothetical protein